MQAAAPQCCTSSFNKFKFQGYIGKVDFVQNVARIFLCGNIHFRFSLTGLRCPLKFRFNPQAFLGLLSHSQPTLGVSVDPKSGPLLSLNPDPCHNVIQSNPLVSSISLG